MFLHARDDIGFASLRVFVQHANNAEDHTRRAIAALERAFRKKGFLHGMKFVAVREAFDGGDLFVGYIADRSDARRDAFSIHEHGASAALSFTAAIFRAGQLKFFSKNIEQWAFGIGSERAGLPVDGDGNSRIHNRAV